jgi:hypothetical protein
MPKGRTKEPKIYKRYKNIKSKNFDFTIYIEEALSM